MRTLLFLFLAALTTAATAQENLFREVFDTKSDSYVEATALFSKPPFGGCVPVRVIIANHTKSQQSARISFSASDGYFGSGSGSKTSISYDFSAEPGHTETRDILVPTPIPLLSSYGNTTSLRADSNGSTGNASGSLNSNLNPEFPATLLSEALHIPNASALDAALKSHPRGRSYGSDEFSAKFDPRMMPDDWRAYAGFDSILMTDHDWAALSPGARNAILAHNRLGSQIIIYQLSSSTDIASLGIDPDAHGSREIKRGSGSVRILPIKPELKLDPASTITLVTKDSPLPVRAKSMRSEFNSGRWPLQKAFGEKTFHYGAFIIILIAFGILVGPINLFVFAKSGRRHRMFITTPVISLGASLLMILLILIMDGLGGKGARVVLMEVRPDHDENAAYLHQEQFSRTGVLLGSGFTLADSAIINTVPLDPSRWARVTTTNNGGGAQYNYKSEDRKWNCSGDWFQSRSEQGQNIESVIPTRGRIERVSTAGPPSFLSSFDFPLAAFYYVDSSGGAWKASDISTGKTFTCQSISRAELDHALSAQRSLFTQRNQHHFDAASPAYRMDSFLATTDNGPAVNSFDSIHWTSTHTVVTGPVIATK
jgi:hypothetical protein